MMMETNRGTRRVVDNAEASEHQPPAFRRALIAGYWIVGLTVGIFVVWAMTWPLASGSYVQGKLALNAKPIDLNHKEGGRVVDLLVSIGDYVEKNEVILRFDTRDFESQLEIIDARLDRLVAERIRRNAEAQGLDSMPSVKPSDLSLEVWQQEENRFVEQFTSLNQQLQIQESRIQQIRDSVEGNEQQLNAVRATEQSIQNELERLSPLLKEQLISEDRIVGLDRQLTNLVGQEASLRSRISGQLEKIEEINLDVARLKQNYRQQAVEQLARLDAQIDELKTQKRSFERKIESAQLTAPMNGWIDDLSIAVEGETIGPGAVIAQFVPDSGSFIVTGRLSPIDIDSVKVGQATTLEFTTFSTRNPPRVTGELQQISAGSLTDPQTGEPYYRVQISINSGQPVFNEIREDLRVGMPVQSLIQSGERTFGEYIASPFVEMTRGAFHE